MQTEEEFFFGIKKAEALQQFLQNRPNTDWKHLLTAEEVRRMLENWQEHSLKSLSRIYSRLLRSGIRSEMKADLVQAYSGQMNELIDIHSAIEKKIVTLLQMDQQNNSINFDPNMSFAQWNEIVWMVNDIFSKFGRVIIPLRQVTFDLMMAALRTKNVEVVDIPVGDMVASKEALVANIQVVDFDTQIKILNCLNAVVEIQL